MPTKDELETENAALLRKVARLEKQVAERTGQDELRKAPPPPAAPEPEVSAPEPEFPSPVDRGQLYVESHPILGVTRKATVTAQSHGDGRIGDGATIERSP